MTDFDRRRSAGGASQIDHRRAQDRLDQSRMYRDRPGDYSKKDDDTGNSGYNTTPSYPVIVLSSFLGMPPSGFAGTSATPATLSSLVVPVTEKFTVAAMRSVNRKLKSDRSAAASSRQRNTGRRWIFIGGWKQVISG